MHLTVLVTSRCVQRLLVLREPYRGVGPLTALRNQIQLHQAFRCRAVNTSIADEPTTTNIRKRNKRRLDDVCMLQYPGLSKNVIQSWIVQGKVKVNDKVVTKSGTQVSEAAAIVVTAEEQKYVCRAGHKLEAALEHFQVNVEGKRVVDSGLSTGGFTDCLLQRGASHVVGVDVGYGQVAERVRVDPRVTVMERTNVRYLQLSDLPGGEPVDLATLDLSFISVVKVLPAICSLLTPAGELIVLIKPQFEAGKNKVGAGGVVRDSKVHMEVIESVTQAVEAAGFKSSGHIASPIRGATGGNVEFLAHFKRLPLS